MLDISHISVGDQVRVAGTETYPRFFHVPGHKEGIVARDMTGVVERLYLPGETDHLDRSDGRDVLVCFSEPKKWKAHFEPSELVSATDDISAYADKEKFTLADIELCEIDSNSCAAVGEFMIKIEDALVLNPSMPMLVAAKLLNSNKMTGAPVAVDGFLVGVLTQFDFLYLEGTHNVRGAGSNVRLDSGKWADIVKKSLASTVAAAMSTPVAVEVGSDMKQVAQLMLSRRFNHMPVVSREGQLVGILTSQDVLRHVITLLDDTA